MPVLACPQRPRSMNALHAKSEHACVSARRDACRRRGGALRREPLPGAGVRPQAPRWPRARRPACSRIPASTSAIRWASTIPAELFDQHGARVPGHFQLIGLGNAVGVALQLSAAAARNLRERRGLPSDRLDLRHGRQPANPHRPGRAGRRLRPAAAARLATAALRSRDRLRVLRPGRAASSPTRDRLP